MPGRLIATLHWAIALTACATALVVNPWVSRHYRDPYINYADTTTGYFYSALVAAALLGLLGAAVRKIQSDKIHNLSLLLTACAVIFLGDRLLLAGLGLPHWIPDPELHYVHRPGAVRVNTSQNPTARGAPIRINSLGFHDDELAPKRPGELRGLFLGDSVVMGFGVPYDSTFANQLERWLSARVGAAQMVNMGIEGYSTAQERRLLERHLDLGPDFVAVGFCMNDLTLPYAIDARLGGTGRFYEVVQSSSAVFGWAANETGLGRLVQWARAARFHARQEALVAAYDVRAIMAAPPEDPYFKRAWDATLGELERIYAIAADRGIPAYLLVFPHSFQLFRPDLGNPQRTLVRHAARHGAIPIDYTAVFEDAIGREIKRALPTARIPVPVHQQLSDLLGTRYFMDDVHFRPGGHTVVAAALLREMASRGLADLDTGFLGQTLYEVATAPNVIRIDMPHSREELEHRLAALRMLGAREAARGLQRDYLAANPGH